MNHCNVFNKLPRHIKSFLSKQCALWENKVQIHKITKTVITEANATNKTEEVSEYKGFYVLGNKYDLTFEWIYYKYKGKFKTIFEEITKGTPDLSVNVLYECAATTTHQNIHDHNALF